MYLQPKRFRNTTHDPEPLLLLLEWSHSVEEEQPDKDQPEDNGDVFCVHGGVVP